ncbi:hypothetical protein TCAL_17014 [Tigriopus californicus]|uniref:Apple domain-containing protein n=1 Tax=Tigriopus californicus TaxID=6832 RepID=A0A553PHM7_TIGCA|nr:hypothetical protein TCAL_17014 [Tigriopus californicus]
MECQVALHSDHNRSSSPASPSTPNRIVLNTENICSALEMPTQNPRVENYMVTKVRDSELGSQFSDNHLDPEGLTDDSDCESKSAQPKRPLVQRIWKYIKAAWTGVTGSGCPGHTVTSHSDVGDEMECQSFCQANPLCGLFCYITESFPNPINRRKCYLKTDQAVLAPASDMGRIAGPKCCDGQPCN